MAKKINMSAVKEFMFNHGEKVALGTCAFLALLLGTLGLVRAFSAGKAESGKPWAKAFEDKRKLIAAGMANAPLPVFSEEDAKQINPEHQIWKKVESNHVGTPYIFFPGGLNNKRTNPYALPIKNVQVDYVSGLAYVHDVQGSSLRCFDAAGAAAGPGAFPFPAAVQPRPGFKELEQNALPPVVKEGTPIRMVVVTAVFPMKQQVEEFQRALRMISQKELFDSRDDLPRPLGINVIKYELVNGKKNDGEYLMVWDGKKLIKGPALDKLLRIAVYDEDTPAVLEKYIYHGLMTPMPKLAPFAAYPKFDFKGFDIAWDELNDAKTEMAGIGALPPGVKDPRISGIVLPGAEGKRKGPPMPPMNPGNPEMQAGGEKKVIPVKSQEVKKADLALYNRLFDKEHDYNIYHVLGQYPPPKAVEEKKPFGGPEFGAANDVGRYFAAWDIDPNGDGAMRPNGVPAPPGDMYKLRPKSVDPRMKPKDPMKTKPAEGQPADVTPNWDRDALVRFIDPDVVPGKSYQYVIQVRLANPNFGKKNLVAFDELATVEEIKSGAVYTPVIDIPHEYMIYAVDQHLLDEWKDEKLPKKAAPKIDPYKIAKDQTTFQIHQWTENARDTKNNRDPYVIGDWAIAERVAVRRGEQIGYQVIVKVPYWNKNKDAFEVPMMKDPLVKDQKKAPYNTPGFKTDLKADLERPVLVDFAGGKRYKGTTAAVEEESAVDALILSPDGKLTVLNSRVQSHAADNPSAKERQDRVDRARERVRSILHGPDGDTGNSNEPKVPGKERPPGGSDR